MCVSLSGVISFPCSLGDELVFVARGDARPVDDFGVGGTGTDVAIRFVDVGEADADVFVHRTVAVEQTMGEEPLVGLFEIEDAGGRAVVSAFEPVVTQTAVVVRTLQLLHDRFRLDDGDSSVGSAVDNPERQLSQSAHVFERRAATERHACCDAVGVGAADIHGAVAAQTHAQDVDARGVALVILLHPVEHLHDLLGAPCSAWILWHDGERVYLTAFDDGIERTVTAHAVEVAAAEAGSVEEDDDGGAFERIEIVCGRVDPEVVASGYLSFHRAQKIVG